MSISQESRAAAPPTDAVQPDAFGQRLKHGLSFRNIGAVYVWALIIIVFTIWVPDTFPTWATVKQLLNGNAVTAMLALALVIPLCARVFDLSVAYVASLSGVTVAYFLEQSLSVVPAVGLGLAIALLVGVINAFVVVTMGVDSFIGTLATGSLIQAFITMITNDIAISDARVAGPFANIAQQDIAGVTLPVFYVLVIATIIWFLLEHTATGRRMYATGFNADAARLTGVRTKRLRFISLLVSAFIAGIAGIVLASTLGSGDPTAGNPYLLSAFAAAFLGATQLRGGRFNAWGTLIAVLMIGTGIIGLGLASAPSWAPNMFTGIVLIAALAITEQERRSMRGAGWMNRLRRKQVEPTVSTDSPSRSAGQDH